MAQSVLCRHLLASFFEPFDLDGQEVIASASIGIAVIEGDQTSNEVLKRAGMALYRAKHEGRATFCLFEPGMELQLRRRRALEWDLKRGLEHGEFELAYQPQIDAGTRKVAGLEALVRWLHPERGVLEAKDFIAEADETGLILPLGAWVLKTACAEAANWPEVRVAVNLSPLQFRHRDLLDLVDRALHETGVAPARLELEIPESALLTDPDQAANILERLRELGVRLVLSDFGQGFTSLTQRHQFMFDQIKIDRMFTTSLNYVPNPQATAHAMQAVAEGLASAVCVEGIETAEQETVLTTAGCNLLQGYHYGTPLGARAVAALLRGDPSGDAEDPQISAA